MCNDWMDKYEFRRLAFRQLVNSLNPRGQSKIAEKTGIDASYLSRMLYPRGKPGKKNIGEDTVDILTKHFPTWLDADVSNVYENPFVAKARSERERKIREIIATIREIDDKGLDLVLHSSKIAAAEHPLSKTALSSQ